MTPPALTAWRTVLTVLIACLMMLIGFLYAVHRGMTSETATAYGSLCLFVMLAATGQAAKGTLEAVANGSGFAGVKAALMTSTKPGESAPPPSAP